MTYYNNEPPKGQPVQPELQSVAVSTTAEWSSHNQRRKRTSSGLVVLNGGANPEGSLSSAIEYQEKYKLVVVDVLMLPS